MGEAAVGLVAHRGDYSPRLWVACGLLWLTAHAWAWRQVVWRQQDITLLLSTMRDAHNEPLEN
jgi:hypothetical protein